MVEHLLNTICSDSLTSSGMYHRYCLPRSIKRHSFLISYRALEYIGYCTHICPMSQNSMGLYNTSTNILTKQIQKNNFVDGPAVILSDFKMSHMHKKWRHQQNFSIHAAYFRAVLCVSSYRWHPACGYYFVYAGVFFRWKRNRVTSLHCW